VSKTPLFTFVQLEFGFLLGPPDGRFVLRETAGTEPDAVLVLATLGATERRRRRSLRSKEADEASPEPVPTSRATVVRAAPLESEAAATAWLAEARKDSDSAADEVATAVRLLNSALHAHRIAHANPHTRDVTPEAALVARLGFGSGEAVAAGRYKEAWRIPTASTPRRPRSMDTPDDRFAAIIGGMDEALTCEELVLRARLDIDSAREREAALQTRVALEALLADIGPLLAEARRTALEEDRPLVAQASNAALSGPLAPELSIATRTCVEHMEDALRAHSLAKRQGLA
jgi:hypothetical protein